MKIWIEPVIDRGQMRLFYPTLGEMIHEDCPVRPQPQDLIRPALVTTKR